MIFPFIQTLTILWREKKIIAVEPKDTGNGNGLFMFHSVPTFFGVRVVFLKHLNHRISIKLIDIWLYTRLRLSILT